MKQAEGIIRSDDLAWILDSDGIIFVELFSDVTCFAGKRSNWTRMCLMCFFFRSRQALQDVMRRTSIAAMEDANLPKTIALSIRR